MRQSDNVDQNLQEEGAREKHGENSDVSQKIFNAAENLAIAVDNC